MPSLLALFTAGFLGILNETVPAGLLPDMSASLGLSESVAGQTITVYAVATALTAIPLNAALKNLGRRTLLVSALGVFAAANLVIALGNNFAVILSARFGAGVAAGLIWSNIGGIAARLVPESARGRAIYVGVTVFNLSIAAGGVLGGLLLAGFGVQSVPWASLAIMIPTIAPVEAGRRHAFPPWSRTPRISPDSKQSSRRASRVPS